jgi:hypothetical protein
MDVRVGKDIAFGHGADSAEVHGVLCDEVLQVRRTRVLHASSSEEEGEAGLGTRVVRHGCL